MHNVEVVAAAEAAAAVAAHVLVVGVAAVLAFPVHLAVAV